MFFFRLFHLFLSYSYSQSGSLFLSMFIRLSILFSARDENEMILRQVIFFSYFLDYEIIYHAFPFIPCSVGDENAARLKPLKFLFFLHIFLIMITVVVSHISVRAYANSA